MYNRVIIKLLIEIYIVTLAFHTKTYDKKDNIQ